MNNNPNAADKLFISGIYLGKNSAQDSIKTCLIRAILQGL